MYLNIDQFVSGGQPFHVKALFFRILPEHCKRMKERISEKKIEVRMFVQSLCSYVYIIYESSLSSVFTRRCRKPTPMNRIQKKLDKCYLKLSQSHAHFSFDAVAFSVFPFCCLQIIFYSNGTINNGNVLPCHSISVFSKHQDQPFCFMYRKQSNVRGTYNDTVKAEHS